MKQARDIALKIAFTYVLLGILWVILSDYVSVILAQEKLSLYIYFQRYKGWFFIFLTGITIFLLVYRRTNELILTNERLTEKEQQLQIQNQHYLSLFERNPDGVFEISLNGNVVSVNQEAEELLESSLEELREVRLRKFLDEEHIRRVTHHFIDGLKGKASRFEAKIHLPNNKSKILRCSLLPIIVNEKVTGMYAVARDITQYRKNEEMMIASEKLSVIGQLAAAVAHEIRNPLTSLKGFIQLMQKSNTINHNHLDIMLSEVDRIDLISGEMLILGKQQDIRFQHESIDDLLKQVIVLMEAQANLENVSIQYDNQSDESLCVMGEGSQLKQVFINIIKNAVEAIPHTRKGKVAISLSQRGDQVFVVVEDNGMGMEPERVERFGEPFYSTKEKGTGLGLAVCQKIIERHKGEIAFHSEKGKGTRVEISLPLKQ
ncbi:PAS domain S-box-containing protein [Bacillus ectoiniformans]|uniref:PAS domain-containing sensor histidine kinase n=1 Tax=Bacillus ectoiniformans TaxID=1494429 RepID=UPI00195D640D|nr:PAS domain-containing sensor histidine kinase [Bacillus ectoiniformans]MBM7649885.1 PAS domain S-box-containing protein [Bacillus ectoiniformans]